METTNSRIRKEVSVSKIVVSRVYKSDFQKKDTLTAELKQTVSTKSHYPTQSVANSLQDNIFGMSDFGFEEKEYNNDEVRVAWIDVPVNSTPASIQAKLDVMPKVVLYRVLSNRPIIADTEKYAIQSPELDVSLDTFANRQVVRFPMGAPNAGELATDTNGKVQYRRIAFSTKSLQDQDIRTPEPADYYASSEIEQELQGIENPAMQSQSI